MEWTEDLAVGIEIIDAQHRELIFRINGLVAAIKKQACKYTIKDTLGFLEDYAVTHFSEEERLMTEHAYPEYGAHVEQHEIFIRNLAGLQRRLPELEGGSKPGSYDLSVETNHIVVDWIRSHILHVDRRLGEYLRQKNLI